MNGDDEGAISESSDNPSVSASPELEAMAANFAPVQVESTWGGVLPMEGAIPDGLEGLLVRNGPNALTAGDGAPWSSGHGMVHAIELRDGAAVSYRNRWVRSRLLANTLDTFVPAGAEEPVDHAVNANAVWIGGELFALSDCGTPYRLSGDLRTLRLEDFGAMLHSPVTAHPHHDAETGAIALSGYDPFGPPFVGYHELDASGQVVHSTDVLTDRCTAQPDFACSASRVAFFDSPAVLPAGPDGARHPAEGSRGAFEWDPEAGARLGVLDRGADGGAVTWIDVEPCFVSHVVNTFDDLQRLVIDVCRYEAFGADGFSHGGAGRPRFERWSVDVPRGGVEVRVLDDRWVDLPRVDDVCAGRSYRYAYCVEFDDGPLPVPIGLVRYDLVRDEAIHRPFHGGAPSEAIFVRAHDGQADDEGWVLTVVYDAGRAGSDLVILDASALATAKPEAVIHLPARVPFGLHGSWVPRSAYS